MLIDRWIALDPWKAMDRMFNDAFVTTPGRATGPGLRFTQDAEAFELRAPLPGVTNEDLELTVEDELVTIKAKRKPIVHEGFEPLRRERQELAFERTYRLPERIDAEGVQAKLDHGVLVVTLPKRTHAGARTITVRAA